MRRALYAIIFVTIGAGAGKCCQYIAINYLDDFVGFELASLIGLTPFVALLLVLKIKYPRYFAFRAGLS